MSVCVLGATGFLGGHLASRAVARAIERGERATLVARAPAEAAVPAGRNVVLRGARAEPRGEIEQVLDEARPAIVFNAIALANIADCDAEPDLARCLNVDLPERLAQWCVEHGAKFVHVSTDLVFAGEPPRATGYREDDEARPRSLYGASKVRGEERVLAIDPFALVARLPLLFGDAGARPRGASAGLLAALARGERPALFADEFRTPLDVGEAATALAELAEREASGLWHVAGPDRLSRAEFARLVLAATGQDERAIRVTTRAAEGLGARPRDVSLDASRARALLGCELSAPAVALARA